MPSVEVAPVGKLVQRGEQLVHPDCGLGAVLTPRGLHCEPGPAADVPSEESAGLDPALRLWTEGMVQAEDRVRLRRDREALVWIARCADELCAELLQTVVDEPILLDRNERLCPPLSFVDAVLSGELVELRGDVGNLLPLGWSLLLSRLSQLLPRSGVGRKAGGPDVALWRLYPPADLLTVVRVDREVTVLAEALVAFLEDGPERLEPSPDEAELLV